MGKPTGFLEYERKTSETIPPKERIKNFQEFHIPLSRQNRENRGRVAWSAAFLSARPV